MKPGDHPDFFRLPPPPGQSRESSIVLDRHGRFHHDGERFAHRGLESGFHKWIRRHPDDGRFILYNGYDWTYFAVEDTPFFVTSLRVEGDDIRVVLSDGESETLDVASLSIDDDQVLRCRVKDGAYEARFTQPAQLMIAPLLADDGLTLVIGKRRIRLGATSKRTRA
jgi:hypothetical protein